MNSDSDAEVVTGIPIKKYRLQNRKSVQGNHHNLTLITTSESQPAKEVTDSESDIENSHLNVDIPSKSVAKHVENSNSTGRHCDDEVQVITQAINLEADTETAAATHHASGPTQKHAATQLNEVPRATRGKARVFFASAIARTISKPFVPLDPASIRRGLQEGGVSSKMDSLKKSMSRLIMSFFGLFDNFLI